MDHKKSKGKMGKVFKLNSNLTTMTFHYVSYCTLSEVRTTGGIKQMGTHNISENGRGAWVVLYAHPSHTDTDTAAV
jgi:hypothetical protein